MKKYIIVALRAMHPIIPSYGLNVDAVPGYLREATEFHRSGICLQNRTWIAFTLLASDAKRFDTEVDAETMIQEVLKADNGWLRPLVILPIFE